LRELAYSSGSRASPNVIAVGSGERITQLLQGAIETGQAPVADWSTVSKVNNVPPIRRINLFPADRTGPRFVVKVDVWSSDRYSEWTRASQLPKERHQVG
jgi:hypothetical protein